MLNKDELKADPEKIKAIQNMQKQFYVLWVSITVVYLICLMCPSEG